MNKLKTFSILTTFLLFSAGGASAEMRSTDNMKNNSDHSMHEKCKVVRDGRNLVKENMADGVGDKMTKMNSTNDHDAWVWVPKDWCNKINDALEKGDMNDQALKNLPQEVKNKLDLAM